MGALYCEVCQHDVTHGDHGRNCPRYSGPTTGNAADERIDALEARVERLEGRFEKEPTVEFEGFVVVGNDRVSVYATRTRGDLQVFVNGRRCESRPS